MEHGGSKTRQRQKAAEAVGEDQGLNQGEGGTGEEVWV